MRWVRGSGIVGGLIAAAALGGCGHEETAASVETTTPVAQAQACERQPVAGTMTGCERQPVAGRDTGNLVLQPEGKYSVPQGKYQEPQGEYLAPKGIYGERGKIVSQGEIMSHGTYGRFIKPEASTRQPEGVTSQAEGTFFKPFGSNEISSERQPVAGRDEKPSTFFVRDDNGRTWGIRNPTLIRNVEQKLSDQGCDPGAIDGVADDQFGKGLTRCQQKLGMSATGILDQATARALGLDWDRLKMAEHHFGK